MGPLIITVFTASLLGSLHCAGMCGAFAAFATATGKEEGGGRVLLHLLYNGGRLVTYSLLGAACGLLGRAVDLGGSTVGLQRTAAVLAGVMMTIFGLVALLRLSGVRLSAVPVPGFLQTLARATHSAAVAWRPAPRAAAMGLLSTLLPCGWLYAFAVTAAGTASPFSGALVMAAFWLGTVPVLAAIGAGVQQLFGRLGRRVPLMAAIAITAVGLYTIYDRITLPAMALGTAEKTAVSNESSTDRVRALDPSKMPCCADEKDESNPTE